MRQKNQFPGLWSLINPKLNNVTSKPNKLQKNRKAQSLFNLASIAILVLCFYDFNETWIPFLFVEQHVFDKKNRHLTFVTHVILHKLQRQEAELLMKVKKKLRIIQQGIKDDELTRF